MIFVLFEMVVMATIIAVLIDQVIIPLWNDTPLLPFVRRHKQESELEHAREDVEAAEVEAQIASLKEQATAIKEKVKK
jgi:hypothetical protein